MNRRKIGQHQLMNWSVSNRNLFINPLKSDVMARLKLRVAKSGRVNPQTKAKGFVARVITNGTARYEDIVAEACSNTTLHKAEAKAALELCMESVAEMLKQGYIVDLGPVGKLYPSCTSGWVKNAEDLQLSSVTPSLYYRPADEVAAAIKGATLQWAKESEADDEETGGSGSGTGDDSTPTPGDVLEG